ncbi:MAG: hypothetical protein ACXW28_12185 [Thermoanaerobaculia bacterium]
MLIIQFTPELSTESAERFASRVLADTLNARHVVVGRNFRFGHRAAGDVALLTELGRELDQSEVDLFVAGPVGRRSLKQPERGVVTAAGDFGRREGAHDLG